MTSRRARPPPASASARRTTSPSLPKPWKSSTSGVGVPGPVRGRDRQQVRMRDAGRRDAAARSCPTAGRDRARRTSRRRHPGREWSRSSSSTRSVPPSTDDRRRRLRRRRATARADEASERRRHAPIGARRRAIAGSLPADVSCCASPVRTAGATRRVRSAGGSRSVPTNPARTGAPAAGSRAAASTAPTAARCLPRS